MTYKILIVLLIGLVTLTQAVNLKNQSLRKKREFAQKVLIATADEVTTGEFKDFKAIAAAAAERTLISTTKNENDFIIGDAGGSGTRLYIGFKDGKNVLQIKSPLKAAEKPKEAAAWVKTVRDVFAGKGIKVPTIIGATAGMRMGKQKLSDNEAIACDADAGTICKMMVLPGTIEGTLGWADGTNVLPAHAYDPKKKPKSGDCYLEIGSTSSQVAVPSSGKLWVMSGVNLAFGIVSTAKTQGLKICNGAETDFDLAKCKAAVQDDNGAFKAHWDANFKKCIAKPARPESLTCTKLLVRQMPAEIMATVKNPSDGACKTDKLARDANYRCVLSFALEKLLGANGLGLGTSSMEYQSVPDDTNAYGVEWAWGLYNIMNPLKFDMGKITFTEHAVDLSDCGEVNPSSGLSITGWTH